MALGRTSGLRRRFRVVLLAVLVGVACSSPASSEEPEVLAVLAEDAANKIAGDFEKLGARIPPVLSGPEGLRIASGHHSDPEVLRPLRRLYLLFLSLDGQNVVVLACDPSTGRKLFEDANCTPKIDLRAWESAEETPCVPALDVGAVCRR